MASVAGVGISSGVLALGSSVAGTSALEACSAKPYTGKTEAELDEYIDRTWSRFVALPHYDERIHWDMYLLYKNFLSHYSVLFVTPGHIEGFCIHLKVNENNKTEFLVDAVSLRALSHKCSDLNASSLGTTAAFTAKNIITTAHNRLVMMGHYHTIFNNCQDYCKELASKILATSIFEIWKEEILEILQAVASIVGTGRVIVRATVSTVESARCTCMQHVGPPTGDNPTKKIKDLYDEYNTTVQPKKKHE